jgi:alpha-D-xyloside xylohydrolase
MDIGGFAVPRRFAPQKPFAPGQTGEPEHATQTAADAEEWRELNTRWFQFGTFVPLLRCHGEYPYREMWELGGETSPAYAAHLKFDRLRYRLLPYVYSVAGAVTHESGTFLRPLVMDFPSDPAVRAVSDQYLFGPALLVSPVTEYKARSRTVVLPTATGGWYDFWTGAAIAGGRTIEAPAPFDAIPLHVRAGAIVPFGPELQWTGEKPADPITLRVYTGADGSFTLYEDDGLSYGYERGASARIPLHWDDGKKALTLGVRSGSFPGMLKERGFEIVLITPQKPAGFSFAPVADKTVRYTGDAVTVQF